MSKPSVLIMANCQGEGFRIAMKALNAQADLSMKPVIVHNAHLEKDSVLEKIKSADIIITQRVDSKYPIEHVRTSEVRKNLTSKQQIHVFPTLYFTGYNPEIVYIKGPDKMNMEGPLGVYQDFRIWLAYVAGMDTEDIIKLGPVELGKFNPKERINLPEAAIRKIKYLESECSVITSDLIEENWNSKQLFHVFGHPSNELIKPVTERLLTEAGIEFDPTRSMGLKQILFSYKIPVSHITRPMLKPEFDLSHNTYTTVTENGGMRHLSWEEFVTESMIVFKKAGREFYIKNQKRGSAEKIFNNGVTEGFELY
jgi:hypothetical protein